MWTDGRAIGFLRGTERVKIAYYFIKAIALVYAVSVRYGFIGTEMLS